MSVDVAARWWGATVHPNGRRGQGQKGVDVFATRANGETIGGQCKNVKRLTMAEIIEEVAAAEQFTPTLAEYWLITSLDVDAALQEEVRKLSDEHKRRGTFTVGIRFWQEITSELCSPRDGASNLLEKYYGDWLRRTLPPGRPRSAEQAPVAPSVDWSTFHVVPEGSFPATSVYLKLVAIPERPRELAIDGDLFCEFRDQVTASFSVVDPEPPPWRPRSDGVELMWRKPGIALHWMRGRDGSVGFATTLESLFKPGHVSLMEVAIDCLEFIRFTASLLKNDDVTLWVDFQPWNLTAVRAGLATKYGLKDPFRQLMPEAMKGPKLSSGGTIGVVSEPFSAVDVAQPFRKLADVLVHRWRPIYGLHGLGSKGLGDMLALLANDVLRWNAAAK